MCPLIIARLNSGVALLKLEILITIPIDGNKSTIFNGERSKHQNFQAFIEFNSNFKCTCLFHSISCNVFYLIWSFYRWMRLQLCALAIIQLENCFAWSQTIDRIFQRESYFYKIYFSWKCIAQVNPSQLLCTIITKWLMSNNGFLKHCAVFWSSVKLFAHPSLSLYIYT